MKKDDGRKKTMKRNPSTIDTAVDTTSNDCTEESTSYIVRYFTITGPCSGSSEHGLSVQP